MSPLRTAILLASAAALAALPAAADAVLLKSGSRVSGKVVESTPRHVIVEVSDFGRVTLKREEIREVVIAPDVPPPPTGPKTPPPVAEKPDAPAVAKPPAATPEVAKPGTEKPETPAAAKTPATPPAVPPGPTASTPLETALRKFQESADPAERAKLIAGIGKGGPETVPALLDLLDQGDPVLTGAVVGAVARLKDRSTVGQVLPKAQSGKAPVRVAAATLLGLVGKSVDPDQVIRKPEPAGPGKEGAAPEGRKPEPEAPKEEIDERAVAALRGLLRDPEPAVRAAAVSGLANLYDAESVEPILALLADRDPAVRNQVQAALLALLPRMKEPARLQRQFVDLLRATDVPEILQSILKTVGELGQRTPMEDDRLIDTVARSFRHEDQRVRAEAFIAIGRVAPVKALAILTDRLFAESEPWVRIQIMTAMASSGNMKAIPPLIDVLEREGSQQMRDAAVRSLQQLGKQFFGGDVKKWREWWARVGPQSETEPPPNLPHTAPGGAPSSKH